MVSAENVRASADYFEQVNNGLSDLPMYVRTGLGSSGYRIIAGKSLPDMHEELAGHIHSSGFHAPTIRTIFLAETYIHSVRNRLEIVEPRGALFHEIGHFVDLWLLGNGSYPDGYGSLSGKFREAYEADMTDLKASDFASFREAYSTWTNDFGNDVNYLTQRFRASVLSGHQTPQEMSAELWCQENGENSNWPPGLGKVMPRSAVVIKNLHTETLPNFFPA